MKKTLLLLGAILAIVGATSARELPEFLQVCKRNDPNLGECIKRSVENFKPYLKTGLPEYKIPSLEPLLLQELTATTGGNIKLKLSNVNVYGASNFTLQRMKANSQTLSFVADVDLPNLSIEGEYDVDGQIILLRIRGSGPMSGRFQNCKGIVNMQAEKVKGDDGQIYMRMANLKTRISVGSGTLKLQNLFGGDPVLGEAVNAAINSNFDSFIAEIKPALESAISNTFLRISNGILLQFPYEAIFPVS